MLLRELTGNPRIRVTEGGNVFKTKEGEILTQRINQADVEPTVRWLETITGYEHLPHMLGTTGKKPTSGDLDIGMPPGATKEELITKLSAWCNEHGVDIKSAIKKSGVSVHFRTPIGGAPDRGYVQTDFMFLPNLEFAKFAMAADPQSNFKDSNKHVMLASVAKHKGLKWSPTTGLVSRENNEVITTNPDEIARTLLGGQANRGSITSVEKILDALKGNPDAEAILADARETLAREGVTI
jgi:hypothetical protein